MSTMSRESADVTLQLIADHLNMSMTSLDVNRTYEELGGDSVTLLRLINSLKSKSIPIPIPVFNSPNTIHDVLTYVQRKDQPTSHEHDLGLDHHQHPSVYRIEPYADVADKEHLINMCCRSFLTNDLLASLVGVSSEDFAAYARNYHEADARRPLSIAVYDTTRGEYVGGSFLCSFTQEHPQGPTSKAFLKVQHVIENLEEPYKRLIGEEAAGSLLYIALTYAEPSLSPSEHLAIFHLAQSEVIDIARRNGFRGVVATKAHYVTQILAETMGYETISQIRIKEVVYEGEAVFKKAPDEYTCKLMVHKLQHPATNSKRLFTCVDQTAEAADVALKKVLSRPRDVEMQITLQERNSRLSPNGHPLHRGYALINSSKEIKDVKAVTWSDRRPVWFVYSGMGAQWPGMARDLMAVTSFRQSIQRSHDYLITQYNIDLLHLVQFADDKTFNVPTNSYLAITAIQIALTDLLASLNIRPDGIVGHSFGEVACGYTDGALTAEEALQCSYWRGRCLIGQQLAPGAMAAIGMTWEEAKSRCPPGVYPACHNAQQMVTVSGPADDVSKFVTQLQSEDIFARQVNSSGVAFHSVYVQPAGESYNTELLKVLPNPKIRSSRWLSTSVAQADWDKPQAALCDTAYMVNNLLSPVLFHEAIALIPRHALIIEISPHCLLQSSIKATVGDTAFVCGLMRRGQLDNLEYFLSSLGQLHVAGLDFESVRLLSSCVSPS